MSNFMKLFLLYFHLIILSHFSTFEADQIITAANVGQYLIEKRDSKLGVTQCIKGNGRTATIQENAFQSLTFKSNMISFKVISFKISTLPDKLFNTNPWFSRSMTYLGLMSLDLERLPERIFHPLAELIVIDLIYNNFSVLHPNLFKNNSKLQSIKILDCNLKTLPEGLFWNNPKLNFGNFVRNKLSVIRRGVFSESNVTHLELNLNSNYIICLPSVFMNVKKLDLTFNCLKSSSKFCKKFKCPLLDVRNDCPSEYTRKSICKDIDKLPVGKFSQWSIWTSCSTTNCSESGTMTRSRTCNRPDFASDCQGDEKEVKNCTKPCLIIGTWSPWSNFTSCSETCGGRGKVTRNRTCNLPQGATDCQGDWKEVKNCFIKSCSTKIDDKADLISMSFTLSLVVVIQAVSIILMCFQ